MESVDLDMGEIFDDERADDDDIGAVSALPDLPDYGEDEQDGEQGDGDNEDAEYGEDEPDGEQGDGDNEDAENTEVLARLKDLSKGAAKKVIRRPQPKLDATRLTGERGIPILPKTFEKLKFKGKGHEAQDLALLMRNMEHWAHRLFPKMPFDEVLERVERLGAKREVQTCVKKMRLDMPILGDDFVGSDKEDNVMRQEDELLTQAEKERDVEEEWEDLLREEHEAQASQTPSCATPGPSHATPGPSRPTPGPSYNTPGLSYDTPGPSRTEPDTEPSTTTASSQKVGSAFTPEQLERMERNKQIAREKRLAKMGIRSPATPLQARPLSGNSQASQEPLSSQEVSSTDPDRVTSPDKQSASQINSQSSTNSDSLDKNYLDNMSSNTLNNHLDSEDQEMSEVIKDLKETVVVKKQDAQNWCTEPFNQTESMEANETSENTFTETENTFTETEKVNNVNKSSKKTIEAESIDSEEMSEVIQQQNAEKVNLNKPSSNSQTENSEKLSEVIDKQDIVNKSTANSQAESSENSEEMSEIIDKQDENKSTSNMLTENSKAMIDTIGKEDNKKSLLESNKENLSVFLNGIDECSKTKTDKLNEKGDNRSNKLLGAVNGDIDMAGDKTAVNDDDDQLDEDELMETLDS